MFKALNDLNATPSGNVWIDDEQKLIHPVLAHGLKAGLVQRSEIEQMAEHGDRCVYLCLGNVLDVTPDYLLGFTRGFSEAAGGSCETPRDDTEWQRGYNDGHDFHLLYTAFQEMDRVELLP